MENKAIFKILNIWIQILIISVSLVSADLPVHCPPLEKESIWKLHVSPQSERVDLFNTREVCTHQLPNRVQILIKNEGNPQFENNQEQIYFVKLNQDGSAQIMNDDTSYLSQQSNLFQQSNTQGSWTQMYDQGLVIESENARFIANFNYHIKKQIITEHQKNDDIYSEIYGMLQQIKWSQLESNFESDCKKTMIGFVQQLNGSPGSMKQHQIQCFFAEQIDESNSLMFGSFQPDQNQNYRKSQDQKKLNVTSQKIEKKQISVQQINASNPQSFNLSMQSNKSKQQQIIQNFQSIESQQIKAKEEKQTENKDNQQIKSIEQKKTENKESQLQKNIQKWANLPENYEFSENDKDIENQNEIQNYIEQIDQKQNANQIQQNTTNSKKLKELNLKSKQTLKNISNNQINSSSSSLKIFKINQNFSMNSNLNKKDQKVNISKKLYQTNQNNQSSKLVKDQQIKQNLNQIQKIIKLTINNTINLQSFKKKDNEIKDKNEKKVQIKNKINKNNKFEQILNLRDDNQNIQNAHWKQQVCLLQKNKPGFNLKNCMSSSKSSFSQLYEEDSEFIQHKDNILAVLNQTNLTSQDDIQRQALLQKKLEIEIKEAQNYLESLRQQVDQSSDKLPKLFSYRNIKGVDYTSQKIRHQQGCGSCHATSFLTAVETRINSMYNNHKQMFFDKNNQLSSQFMLSCNYLNEGCNGGSPIFNSFLAEQAYLVSEQCAPYEAQVSGNSCKKYQQCKPIAKVKKTYFVSNKQSFIDQSQGSLENLENQNRKRELQIQKEILMNGPVVANLKAPQYFKFYQMGVLSSDQQSDNFSQLVLLENQENQNEQISLEQKLKTAEQLKNQIKKLSNVNTDHSVAIIGWGEMEPNNSDLNPIKKKYWIARNSFGPEWGYGGDFYIARGNNEMGIEQEVFASQVVLCASNSESQCIEMQ